MRLLVLGVLLAGCGGRDGNPFDIEGGYVLTWSCEGAGCDQMPWFAFFESATFDADASTWVPDCAACVPPTAPISRHESGCITVHDLNTGTGIQLEVDFDLCPAGNGFDGDVVDGWSVAGVAQ